MGVYNKKKCEEMLLEYGYETNLQPINELSDAGIIVLSTVIPALVVATFITGSVMLYKKWQKKFKAALDKYLDKNPDCIPISEFDRKVYDLKPFLNDPDKELDEKAAKKAEKYGFDHAVCYFKDDKLVMFYTYKVSAGYYSTTYHLAAKILDKNLAKHSEYYYSCFCYEKRMCSEDIKRWIKKTLEEE